MSPLLAALKKKFRRPQDALRALGLDEDLLRLPKLAFDAHGEPEHPKVAFEKYLAQNLQGETFVRAQQMLHSLEDSDGKTLDDYDRACEDETDPDHHADSPDHDRDEGHVENRLRRLAHVLREAGLGEDDVEEAVELARRDYKKNNWNLPRNATKGGIGGRFSEASDHRKMSRDARKRKLGRDGRDAANKRDFYARFPQARRLTAGSQLLAGIPSGPPDQPARGVRRIAVDAADDSAAADFHRRFPGASRIGIA